MVRKYVLLVLFNALIVTPLNVIGQKWLKPVRNPILLSGNFGELRATHFHSGIDIRTGGMEGWPVICVQDGRLVRVTVSPTGYGQALYIEHPDGTTTVYGHLQRFIPEITARVRELQYQQESFRIDEDFRDSGICFKQGDTIAYSGNSGSSGGPHLHFEVRNTATEHVINPLLYYSVNDTKTPVVRKLYLYTVSEKGCVELFRMCALKHSGNGKYDAGRITVPAGKIGIGLYITDYMNDSWNKLGIYRMNLVAGQDTLFSFQMDSCAFDQNALINELKDFACYKKKETVYRCFGNHQVRLLSVSNRGKGYISVEEDSLVKVRVDLSDVNGNRSSVGLALRGGKPLEKDVREVLDGEQTHVLELSGCRMELEQGALLASVRKKVCVEQDTVAGKKIYRFSEQEEPLLKKARLWFSGVYDVRSLICEVADDGRLWPLETVWKPEGIEARAGCLSRYTVVEDRESPQITYLGKFSDRTLRFKIKDDFSGIATFRGEVNGKWCLFSYDPRVDLLKCSLSEPVFRKGQPNEVKITVTDKVGNKQELEVNITK